MTIATSITKDYLQKSMPFFESVNEHWQHSKVCFTIGFNAIIDGWITVPVMETDCKWRPRNRSDYYSLQHGEFIKHYKFDKDEMIMFVDSDMILQRPFDLDMPATDAVCVTACSFPQLNLYQVVKNLGCKKRHDKFADKYKVFLQREFCACFILAKASTWADIYHKAYYSYDLLDNFTHHAAWQLLINAVISNNFKVFLLPPSIVNATWYEGTPARVVEDKLRVECPVKDKGVVDVEVYFNHTKFNTDAMPQTKDDKEGSTGGA